MPYCIQKSYLSALNGFHNKNSALKCWYIKEEDVEDTKFKF